MRYSVKINYKICFYLKKNRKNLKYDVKINNKYYKKTLK